MIYVKTTMKKMPKNCKECSIICKLPCENHDSNEPVKEEYYNKRHKDCPLIEMVPKEKLIQTIVISKDEMTHINDLLHMTGEEIYQKYGYQRDETIIHTATFPDGIEADIKLVICEEESPYTEGILFHNGCQITCTEPSDDYEGEWNFEYNGTEYIVNVTS